MHRFDLRLRLGGLRLLGMGLGLGRQGLRVRHVVRLRLGVRLRLCLEALRLHGCLVCFACLAQSCPVSHDKSQQLYGHD